MANLPTLVDDGLVTEEIGDWGQEKYQLLNLYVQLFSASMKSKWDCRVYIDLFAGSGRSRVKETTRIVAGSPLIALDVDPPFDHYIFCEKNTEKVQALETRGSGLLPTTRREYAETIPQRTWPSSRAMRMNSYPKFSTRFRSTDKVLGY